MKSLVSGVAALILGAAFLAHVTRPMHAGRPIEEWVRDAVAGDNASSEAQHVVSFELKERALPYIIRELKARTISPFYVKCYVAQFKLPTRLRLLPAPTTSDGVVQQAAWVLSEMAECARPAIPVLVRALKQACMHPVERRETVHYLIGMGPVAEDALPMLRTMTRDPKDWAVEAGLAIYQINFSTEGLRQGLETEFAQGDLSVGMALYWFLVDPTVNAVLAEVLDDITKRRSTPAETTNAFAAIQLAGDLAQTNMLFREILQELEVSDEDARIREAARTALQAAARPEEIIPE